MNYPQKRWAAGALFFDADWRVLLLEPTYKNNWEIPGWIIEDNESPKEACEREVFEELWLKREVWELLCLEYQREEDDSYMFVFDWGVLSNDEIEKIIIQKSEIKSFGFYDIYEIEDKVLKKMFMRIKKTMWAKQEGKMIYYETVYKGVGNTGMHSWFQEYI